MLDRSADQPADGAGDRAVRVAIDVGPLYGHRTGVAIATHGLVDALSRRTDVALEPYVVSFRSELQPNHRRLPIPGLVASHLWSRTDRPAADRWLRGAEVVHGTNYVVPPSKVPALVTVYDCWFLRHPQASTPVVRRAAARLRRAVKCGAHVHAASSATAAEVRELLATDRVSVIPLGAPPTLAPGRASELPVGLGTPAAPFVVAIGTEERRKDLPLLVDAFELLATRDHHLRLVLAGARGDASTDLDRRIAGLDRDVAARVVRLGAVDDSTKQRLLQLARALAYPSLDEGFGFPVLEAQRAGVPVVATDVGSIAEIGGEGVRLVAGRRPATFADALATVLADSADRLGLIAAGLRNVDRFDWASTAEQLVALYRLVASEAT